MRGLVSRRAGAGSPTSWAQGTTGACVLSVPDRDTRQSHTCSSLCGRGLGWEGPQGWEGKGRTTPGWDSVPGSTRGAPVIPRSGTRSWRGPQSPQSRASLTPLRGLQGLCPQPACTWALQVSGTPGEADTHISGCVKMGHRSGCLGRGQCQSPAPRQEVVCMRPCSLWVCM